MFSAWRSSAGVRLTIRFGATAFLSSRPDEESHEIALFANPAFAHVAFKVSSLAELRSVHARVVERNIPVKFAADHGVSLAFYFDDPDGNMIEVYWPTRDGGRSRTGAACDGTARSVAARGSVACEGGAQARLDPCSREWNRGWTSAHDLDSNT